MTSSLRRRTARLVAPVLVAMAVVAAPAPVDASEGSLVIDLTAREHGSVAVVGDSLTYAYWGDLPKAFAADGWGPFAIEARSARRTVEANHVATSGIDAVRRLRANGFDPHLWIIALGTNDLFLAATSPTQVDGLIDEMMDEIGDGHEVVWVNLYTVGRRAELEVFNARLQRATLRHPNLVVADWFTAIDPHPEWTGPDGVHPNLDGARERNRFLADAGMLAPVAAAVDTSGWPLPRR